MRRNFHCGNGVHEITGGVFGEEEEEGKRWMKGATWAVAQTGSCGVCDCPQHSPWKHCVVGNKIGNTSIVAVKYNRFFPLYALMAAECLPYVQLFC